MDDKDEYILMKKYVTMDIEGSMKEYDAEDWLEEDEKEEISWAGNSKHRPFSYDKMLTGVMEHLERTGGVEFAIIKDPELGRWWKGKVTRREIKRKTEEAREKLNSVLSKEEQKLLGIHIK